MKVLIIPAVLAASLLSLPAAAADEEALAKKHNCLACHAVDKKVVGPAYKDIAAKSKGKKVEDEMAVMKSKPVHGSVLKKTSDSSLKEIMEWILSL